MPMQIVLLTDVTQIAAFLIAMHWIVGCIKVWNQLSKSLQIAEKI